VISVLPTSSTLLQDGYYVHSKHTSKQDTRGDNHTVWITSKERCPINLLSDSNPDAVFISNSDTISKTISKCTETISEAVSKAISESISDVSHFFALLQEGRLQQSLWKAVGEHLCGRYIPQVDLSISNQICCKIVLGYNVCHSSSVVDSVLVPRDQWVGIGEHLRGSWDAELIQEMWDLYECHASYSEGVVFGISHALGSRLLNF
jgi:hypothetical protein